MSAPTAPFFGLGVCRDCGDDYFPSSEEDDLCVNCRSEDGGAEMGEQPCLNCGRQFVNAAGPYPQFCSDECASLAHAAIVNPHDWRL